MQPLHRILLRLPVLCLLPLLASAQFKEQGGLMWRISGKGLSAPSYLYGTIHLADKRVFNFPDSLYAALERTEGYAMELNPDSLMVALFLEDDKEDKFSLLKDKVNPKDLVQAKKKLQEVFKKPVEKITAIEFKEYCEDLTNLLDNKNKMQTFMDAWLFNAAKRQGKWVGGIEDVEDQIHIKGKFSYRESLKEFMKGRERAKLAMEEMVRSYAEDDLQQMEMIDVFMGEITKDSIMLRRNAKMARRIDSLATIRTMFFAIGAAHLPGDSGVVSLLRKRGFNVTPVVSNQRIHADQYKFPVKKLPWVKVKAASDALIVEMPGLPQKDNSDPNADIKMYADVSTNLYYAIIASRRKLAVHEDSLIAEVMKNINSNAKIISKRSLSTDSLKGMEITANADDASLRMQVFYRQPMMYMLMVGTPVTQPEGLQSEDAERFFQSLELHAPKIPEPVKWEVFKEDRYGFSVLFPGKPLVKKQELGPESHVTGTTFAAPDSENSAYFQCLVQQLDKGYYLTGDSAVFDLYLQNISQNPLFRLTNEWPDTVQGYPGRWTEFMVYSIRDSSYSKVLNVHRGNRLYYLIVTVQDKEKAKSVIDSFFNSFHFDPVKENSWSLQAAPDKSFSAWSASPIERYIDSTEIPDPHETIFLTHDDAAPVSFFIRKDTYPRYFWESSDTALIRRQTNANIGSNDSILLQQPFQQGPFKGMDLLVKMADNHNLKKIRILLAADTMYTIYGMAAKEFLDQADRRKFFEQFTVHATNTTSTLFTPKWPALLQALQSKDSASFAEAKNTLSVLNYKKEDLPVLHKAMLEVYADSTQYNNVNHRLFRAVAGLKDASTIEVVQDAYLKLSPEKEALRFDLLGLLVAQRTPAAVNIMKDLLLQRPPKSGEAYRLFNEFDDTLALAVPILADLIPLLKDSLTGDQIISLADQLLDSNLVRKSTLMQYKAAFYERAAYDLQQLKQAKEPDYNFYNRILIGLLAKFNEPAAWQWIRKFVAQPNLYVKYIAVTTLLNYQQSVDATAITKLAADKEYRQSLYDELERLNKTQLFPKQYLTQQAFAESELYGYASDENDVKKITFLGQRLKTFKKKQAKFYLFKIDTEYDGTMSSNLGIAGPYHPTSTKFDRQKDATGIIWTKTFNAATIDADLKTWLKEWEESEEEN